MPDETDSRLLSAVQANAQITAQELGDLLNLSASQAARRRARLESDGLISGYSARLSPQKLGLTVQAFIQVHFAAHSPEAARDFLRLISTLPEVVACWTLTGEADYMLKVAVGDLKELSRLVNEVLLPHESVARVRSEIALETLKEPGLLPLRLG